MIQLENYYSFPASEVVLISKQSEPETNSDYPHNLIITLRNSQKLTIAYNSKDARDKAAINLRMNVERELRADKEQILNRLFLILDHVKRIDKRQLKIWKILKERLPDLNNELEDNV